VNAISATLTVGQASATTWDAIVIGAGPAGAFAALGLARAGFSTLLVDRKAFPRYKVCGGCLNRRAIGLLERAGVTDEIRALGARPISSYLLRRGGRQATLAGPPGLAVTRATLDGTLVRAAISAGCAFLSETTALVPAEDVVLDGQAERTRRVVLQQHSGDLVVSIGRIVIVAGGLGHTALRDLPSMSVAVAPDARVGVGTIADAGCVDTPPGCVTMVVGSGGYVGVTAVEDACVSIAAALDVAFLKSHGRPAAAVGAILASAHVQTTPALDTLDWQGTPPLTRRIVGPVARRVFVLGDAAGYVEPFTGEGIGWALAAGDAVVPIAARAVTTWNATIEREWLGTYDRIVRHDQRWCRVLARALRHPRLAGAVIATLGWQPGLARPFFDRAVPGAAAVVSGDHR
jgi:flavin-dependent dehydrogenase